MRPDRPPGKRNGPDTTPGRSRKHSTTADEAKATLAAWRCWTWRERHGCGCSLPADCLLLTALPVHSPQPCAGEFTAAGWAPHCRDGAA